MPNKYMRDDDFDKDKDPVFNQPDPIDDFDAAWELIHDRVHEPAVNFVASTWGDTDAPDDVLSEEVRIAAACMGTWLLLRLLGEQGTHANIDRDNLHALLRSCIQLGYSMKHHEDNGLLNFSE